MSLLTNEEVTELWHDWEESNIDSPGADKGWEDTLLQAQDAKSGRELVEWLEAYHDEDDDFDNSYGETICVCYIPKKELVALRREVLGEEGKCD